MPENSSPRRDSQATNGGPSWGLMLFFMGLAMVVALVIAWLFIHPLLQRHF